ncbi:RCC1 domain-containing protein [Candidatus Poriferisodalis sp.]|uniref:RCC1 domain-containing protein n=1 Tax=Candidatus Poriferisodalis sp. TaxID=3101277 RepID=UPI003B0243AC
MLGGIAAVPAAKIAGRDMTRLGGVTRWATAELVGRRASGDTTAGTRTATETDNTDTEPAGFTAVSGGGDNGCALRVDGSIACWYPVWDGVTRYDQPVSGKFTALWGDGWDGCGLRTDGNLSCWNAERALVANDDRPVSGKFTALSVRGVSIRSRGCGVLTDGNLSCWLLGSTGMLGSDDDRTVSAVSGKFTAVGGNGSSGCGLRTDGRIVCWQNQAFTGNDLIGDPPVSGKFTALTGGNYNGCGVRTDGSLACWSGSDSSLFDSLVREVMPVSGTFIAVTGGPYSGCGLRTDGSFACWDTGPDDDLFSVDLPVSGKFTAMSGRHFITGCGLRTDGSIACWHNGEAAAPPV